jgi:hypothetical protein
MSSIKFSARLDTFHHGLLHPPKDAGQLPIAVVASHLKTKSVRTANNSKADMWKEFYMLSNYAID